MQWVVHCDLRWMGHEMVLRGSVFLAVGNPLSTGWVPKLASAFRKQIFFDVHKGLSIITSDGKNLRPSMLSSGERHLLLIFCNTAVSLDHPSIFIVDEPEISLNIKWQRSLIESLSKCIGNNPVQFIFATHSLEIISQYRDRVFKLVCNTENKNG